MFMKVAEFLTEQNFTNEIKVSIFKDSDRVNPIFQGNFKQNDFITELSKQDFALNGCNDNNEIFISIKGQDYTIQIMDFDFDHELFWN